MSGANSAHAGAHCALSGTNFGSPRAIGAHFGTTDPRSSVIVARPPAIGPASETIVAPLLVIGLHVLAIGARFRTIESRYSAFAARSGAIGPASG